MLISLNRFIKIYHEDKKVIMEITGCENCPLMQLHTFSYSASCRIFSNKTPYIGRVEMYNIETNKVFGHLIIPQFCQLPSSVEGLSNCELIYKISSIMISTEYINKDEKLPTIKGIPTLKKPLYKAGEDFIIKKNNIYLPDNTTLLLPETVSNTPRSSSIFPPTTPVSTPVYVKKDTCSVCGTEEESVDRKKNLGMCDECNLLYKNNNKMKQKAFINNFRLKRKVDFVNKKFKFNKEILINV